MTGLFSGVLVFKPDVPAHVDFYAKALKKNVLLLHFVNTKSLLDTEDGTCRVNVQKAVDELWASANRK